MFWFDIWDRLYYNKPIKGTLSAVQSGKIKELAVYAKAHRAIDFRIKTLEQNRSRLRPINNHTFPHEKALNIAFDYEAFYNCGKLREVPLYHPEGIDISGRSKAELTKHTYYLKTRNKEIIEKEIAEYRTIRAESTNDRFIFHLYQKYAVTCAFTDKEIACLIEIYEFAKYTELPFSLTKRTDKRTKLSFNKTYVDFYSWYQTNSSVYSCRDRFFIPLFMKYGKPNGYSLTELHYLLYCTNPDCFTEKDKKKLGVSRKRKDFFDVLSKLHI